MPLVMFYTQFLLLENARLLLYQNLVFAWLLQLNTNIINIFLNFKKLHQNYISFSYTCNCINCHWL